jgi:glucose/arabinose dehydrogenase
MSGAILRSLALLLACTAAGPPPLSAGTADSTVYLITEVMHAASAPSAIRFAPDGRLFQLELWTGDIRVFPDTLPTSPSVVWAHLPVMTEGERGLLGFDFHPQYPDSPFVYFFHTDPADTMNRIVRLRDTGSAGTDLAVLFELPSGGIYHQGGRIAFGPSGLLHVLIGDEFLPAQSQNLSVLPGKILRLTPMGEPAPGNPSLGGRPEILAFGNRNMFGICFDSFSGQGYFTENGPECDDEINALSTGANYGWSPTYSCDTGQTFGTDALLKFTPTIAPTGCTIYRNGYIPEFEGDLFFGAFNDGVLRRVEFVPGEPLQVERCVEAWSGNGEPILDVTQGPDGKLWVATGSSLVRLARNPNSLGVGGGSGRAAVLTRPNPFTGTVTFAPSDGEAVRSIEVMDVTGRLVRRLEGSAGPWVWDGRDGAGQPVPAGIYLARVRTDRGERIGRLTRLGP